MMAFMMAGQVNISDLMHITNATRANENPTRIKLSVSL